MLQNGNIGYKQLQKLKCKRIAISESRGQHEGQGRRLKSGDLWTMTELSCGQKGGCILSNADKSQCVEAWLRNNSQEFLAWPEWRSCVLNLRFWPLGQGRASWPFTQCCVTSPPPAPHPGETLVLRRWSQCWQHPVFVTRDLMRSNFYFFSLEQVFPFSKYALSILVC